MSGFQFFISITGSGDIVNAKQNPGWYDRIEEFKVDSKADCGQLNQAQVTTRNKKKV